MKNELTAEIIACLREHASFKCIEGNEKRMVLAASDLLEAKDAEIAALKASNESLVAALNQVLTTAYDFGMPYDCTARVTARKAIAQAVQP